MAQTETAPKFTKDGRIIDFLTDQELEDHPEERIRQRYLWILHNEYHYPKEVLDREVPIYYGRQELTDEHGNPRRADIAVYEDHVAKTRRDQGRIRFVVESKAADEESGHNQLMSYIFTTSANGAVWYNGSQTKFYRRLTIPEVLLGLRVIRLPVNLRVTAIQRCQVSSPDSP